VFALVKTVIVYVGGVLARLPPGGHCPWSFHLHCIATLSSECKASIPGVAQPVCVTFIRNRGEGEEREREGEEILHVLFPFLPVQEPRRN
jgi:hypothetical protein